MADDADIAGPRIEAAVDDGVAHARRDLESRLRPIIVPLEGTRHSIGLCHYCESNIAPGHLFCHTDKEEPAQSCSALWEHEMKRMKDMGL